MLNITLKGGDVRQVEENTTVEAPLPRHFDEPVPRGLRGAHQRRGARPAHPADPKTARWKS